MTEARGTANLHPLPEMNLRDPEAVVDAGMAARNAGREEDGVALVRAALRIHPANPRLWQVLGLLHRALQDSSAAVEAFAEAARLAPHDRKIAHGRAHVTLEAGRPALALFERARQYAPYDGDLLLGRAAAQLAEGRGEEAAADLAATISQNPNWLAGQATLARVKWMIGHDDFTAGFERALAADSRNLPLWLDLINILVQSEKYTEADAVIGRARAAAGPHVALDISEAACASELGDVARADRIFAIVGRLPDAALAARHMRHLLRTGRPEEAGRRGEPFIGGPEAGPVWPYLSLAWRLTGDRRWDWLEGDPRLVGVYDIEEAPSRGGLALDGLAARLRALHATAHPPLGQSVRHGTQTDGPLFARAEPEICELRKLIVATLEKHIASLPPPDPAHPVLSRIPSKVRFAGSWSVRLKGSGHHTNHIHPLGWLSSAFYVVVPSEHDLGPEPAGWLALGQPPDELATGLPPVRMVKPRPGRLILFPSTMWHGTVPYDRGERMSVAFDVAPA